ncbi:MAG: phenylacetate--CoA ligase [Clostridiales bacterium]|nr:phenylacetate--CoA ligase [Clostridiales bacterium]
MIWAKEETLSRNEIEEIQLAKLKKTVEYVYEKLPAYRVKMEAVGVKPEHIKTLADVKHLPFITKQDMRDQYPFGWFAVPQKDIVRIHASSGTTGKPTVVGYTRRDLENWAECVARLACAGGASSESVAQICFGYGMFTGALGLHSGLERIGAAIIPSSTGNTQKQIMYMIDFGTSLLVATPSYALRIAEVAMEMGLNPRKDINLKVGLFGSEMLTDAIRAECVKVFGDQILVTSNYGMSEIGGPGVSGECEYLCGFHINEDHFLCEVIDPKTGEVLPYGERGELVVTCLDKETQPLVRYRTRDITRLICEPCKCGRTTIRMENFSGRTDDMLKIKGVNVFPSQIEEVLLSMEEIGPHYEIIVEKAGHTDKLTIRVELAPDKMTDDYQKLKGISKRINSRLKVILGLDTIIKLESPNTLQRFEGKAKRVRDLRPKETLRND